LVSIVVGIPVYLLFRRFGWSGRRHRFLLGAMIGSLSGALFALAGLINTRSAGSQVRDAVVAGAVIGFVLAGVVGLIFAWLIRPTGSNVEEVAATFD
jgi:zinc transporter ZupT